MLYQLSYTRVSAGKADSGDAGKLAPTPLSVLIRRSSPTLLPRFPAYALPR
jgi:hypothetical protein